MTRNPLLNALSASFYITVLVLVMSRATEMTGHGGESIIIPIIMLSLFTLSAAVMGFVFCYQPIRIYFEGNRQAAVKLFLQTLGIFAFVTLVFVFAFLLYAEA